MDKTYKREFAFSLVIYFLTLAGIAFWQGDEETRLKLLDMLTWPVFGTAITAFGMTWVTKQTNLAGPPAGNDPPNQ